MGVAAEAPRASACGRLARRRKGTSFTSGPGFARASCRPWHPQQSPRPHRQGARTERDPDPPGVGQEVRSFRGDAPQMGQREESKDDARGENIGSHGNESWGWGLLRRHSMSKVYAKQRLSTKRQRSELSSCRQGGREHGEGEDEAAETADRDGDVAPRAEVRLPIQSANREDQAGSKYDQNDDQPQRRNAEQRDGYRDRTTIARYRTDQHQSETREHAQKATENQFGGGQHGPWPFQLGGRGQHSGNGGQLGESTTFRLVAPVANKIDECNDQAPEHDEKRQDKDGYKL